MTGPARGSPAPGPAPRPRRPCPRPRPPPTLRGSDVITVFVATFLACRGLTVASAAIARLWGEGENCAPGRHSGEPPLHDCSPPRGPEGSRGGRWLQARPLHSQAWPQSPEGHLSQLWENEPPSPIGAATSLTAEQARLTYQGEPSPTETGQVTGFRGGGMAHVGWRRCS